MDESEPFLTADSDIEPLSELGSTGPLADTSESDERYSLADRSPAGRPISIGARRDLNAARRAHQLERAGVEI